MCRSKLNAVMSGIVGAITLLGMANSAWAATGIALYLDLKDGSAIKLTPSQSMHIVRSNEIVPDTTRTGTAGKVYRPKSVEITVLPVDSTVIGDASRKQSPFDVKLDCWATNQAGQEVPVERITLTNALITSINFTHWQANDTHQLEKISLTFQKIEIVNLNGSTSTTDDWTASS